MKILITIVNYNTAELLSHLLFSLYRIMGSRPLHRCDILIVDNNSTDKSVRIIKALENRKLVRSILNKEQMYHGPALNQGINIAKQENYDFFWSIDSDVVVLRPRIIKDMINTMQNNQLDMIAQANDVGELHVSCMVLRVDTLRKLRGSFKHSGNPSRQMECSWRQSGAKVQNFPFRHGYYIIHAGCGTRKVIKDTGDSGNHWFGDIADCSPWYHGDLLAPTIHADFKQIFKAGVPRITPKALIAACIKRGRIRMRLPKESPGIDPHVMSPTARGRRANRARRRSGK